MSNSRVLANVSKNIPSSRREFERYPPVKFPICLHLLFNRRDSHLIDKLKLVLDKTPKNKARYSKTHNRYQTLVSFRCYFNGEASVHAAVEKLEGENLWAGILLDDRRVSSKDLVEQARISCFP